MVAARRGTSLSIVAAGPAGAAAAPRPKAPPPGLPLPAVMDRRLVVDVPDKRDIEKLKHDLALQKELVAQVDQRVRTLEALRRQEPARGGPVRKWDAWWDNDGAGSRGDSERGWLPEGPPRIANRAAALPPPGGTACGVGAHRRWPMFRIGGRQTGALAMRCDKSTEMTK